MQCNRKSMTKFGAQRGTIESVYQKVKRSPLENAYLSPRCSGEILTNKVGQNDLVFGS